MPPHAYTQDQLVEQPAIGLFAALGGQTVSAMEETFGPTGTLQRETKGEVENQRRHVSERFLQPGRFSHRRIARNWRRPTNGCKRRRKRRATAVTLAVQSEKQ